MATPSSQIGAAQDLGLGGQLGQQVQAETEEERKKRMLQIQQQQAVYPVLSEPWKETSAVLDDLSAAWRIGWQAEHEPEAGQ